MIKDMTQGSPFRLLVLFTLPLLLGNIFQQFYNFADTLIVGRTLGENALGAVGGTGSLCFLIFGFFFGITSGCTVITAQRFGARDYEGVRRSVATSVIISSVITIFITTVFTPLTRPILELMQTPPELIDMSEKYLVVIFLGTAGMTFYNLLAGFIRALGDSRTPLIFLVVACLLNIVLDLIFILNFGWGVTGAAAATVLAQVLSGAGCLVFVIKRFPLLHLKKHDWRWNWNFAKVHLAVAVPMALQFTVIAIGVIILQVALNRLGATVINAFSAASRIDQLAIQPMISIGVAMATFAAQNYGAGRIDRIRRGVRVSATIAVGAAIIGTVVIINFGHYLIEIFFAEPNPETVDYALTYLKLSAFFYAALGLIFVFRNTLQGVGRAEMPLLSGIFELVIRAAGAVFMISRWGFIGACLISPLAWAGGAILTVAAYFWVMHHLKPAPRPDDEEDGDPALESSSPACDCAG